MESLSEDRDFSFENKSEALYFCFKVESVV